MLKKGQKLSELNNFLLQKGFIPKKVWVQIITGIVFLTAWEIAGRSTSDLLFAPVSEVILSFFDLLFDPEFVLFTNIGETMFVMLSGYAAASVFGVALGILMGRSQLVYEIVDPFVILLYSVPRVALIPLFMLWLGLGASLKITMVFLASHIEVLVNTHAGVRNIDEALLEPARSLMITRRHLLTKVIIPATLPYIVAGLKLGLGRALTAVVVAEFFVSVTGLGGMIFSAASQFRIAVMLVPAIILAFTGITIDILLSRVQRRSHQRFLGEVD